jgi:hypothetical protein
MVQDPTAVAQGLTDFFTRQRLDTVHQPASNTSQDTGR